MILIHVITESGGDIESGDYTVEIINHTKPLDISASGGCNDIDLIKACVEDNLSLLPSEGVTEIILKEDGEWEDVFWNKYYSIEKIRVLDN